MAAVGSPDSLGTGGKERKAYWTLDAGTGHGAHSPTIAWLHSIAAAAAGARPPLCFLVARYADADKGDVNAGVDAEGVQLHPLTGWQRRLSS